MKKLVIIALITNFFSCASAPKKIEKAEKIPLADIVIAEMKIDQPTHYALSFTPGQAYPLGLEMSYELLNKDLEVIRDQKIRLGPSFNGATLKANQKIQFDLKDEFEGKLKIVGGPRPGAGIKDELKQVEKIRLTTIKRCEKRSFHWEPGMPLPGKLDFTPKSGDLIEEVICKKLVDDQPLASSLRFHRVADPNQAKLSFSVEFNKDFEKGVTVELDLINAIGKADPKCHLHISQPTVWETQRMTYQLGVTGVPLVELLTQAKVLNVRSYKAVTQKMEPYIDVRLRCEGREDIGVRTDINEISSGNAHKPRPRRGIVIE